MILRALSVFVLLCPAARAEDMTFDLSLRGLNAARIVVETRVAGGAYALASGLATTGLVGAVSARAYGIRAEGRLDGREVRPLRAELDDRSGEEQGLRVLRWSGGVGPVVEANPPLDRHPWSVDRGAAGAVDPLSAFWSILRAGARADICGITVATFDGVRAGRIVVNAAMPEGAALTCDARFERLGGYSPDEMAERRTFPFTLVFSADSDGTFRAAEIRARTPLGQAMLRRR